ncbi:uncharacterized protein LOC116200749 isoform X1 [Punica granatum]|uniref:Uncharacterized protein LOC116200749 isoform X1 n=1 Tax=Punica granatum TaxID=22663 RepID=A0A6P8CZB2_PUNGR|nr:uncharacterized protein LOC116200749 isoform X1 [Punica granatum]
MESRVGSVNRGIGPTQTIPQFGPKPSKIGRPIHLVGSDSVLLFPFLFSARELHRITALVGEERLSSPLIFSPNFSLSRASCSFVLDCSPPQSSVLPLHSFSLLIAAQLVPDCSSSTLVQSLRRKARLLRVKPELDKAVVVRKDWKTSYDMILYLALSGHRPSLGCWASPHPVAGPLPGPPGGHPFPEREQIVSVAASSYVPVKLQIFLKSRDIQLSSLTFSRTTLTPI